MTATFCAFFALQEAALAEQLAALAEQVAACAEQVAALAVHVVAAATSFFAAQQASPALATTAKAVTVRIIRSFFINSILQVIDLSTLFGR